MIKCRKLIKDDGVIMVGDIIDLSESDAKKAIEADEAFAVGYVRGVYPGKELANKQAEYAEKSDEAKKEIAVTEQKEIKEKTSKVI